MPSRSPLSYKDGLNSSISWANYDAALADNDNTEKDLYFCISANAKYDKFSTMCGMIDGDVEQPIIKLRGNRAYLCYWLNQINTIAYKEVRALGIDESSDLFQVAGCLLRLAMWPTDKLFQLVEEMGARMFGARNKMNTNDNPDIHEQHLNSNVGYQIGVHFRCGDVAFKGRQSLQQKVCTFHPGDTEDGEMERWQTNTHK